MPKCFRPIAYFYQVLFLLYAKLEEDYGLARHALQVLDRALQRVKDDDKIEIFQIYVSKASEMFGVAKTREVYEKAIQTLPKHLVRFVIMQYAQLELKLGEASNFFYLENMVLNCVYASDRPCSFSIQLLQSVLQSERGYSVLGDVPRVWGSARERGYLQRNVTNQKNSGCWYGFPINLMCSNPWFLLLQAQSHFVQSAVAQAQALASVAQGEKNVQMPANDVSDQFAFGLGLFSPY